eukprot:7199046-Pyramimonas_sp.AAC.1
MAWGEDVWVLFTLAESTNEQMNIHPEMGSLKTFDISQEMANPWIRIAMSYEIHTPHVQFPADDTDSDVQSIAPSPLGVST